MPQETYSVLDLDEDVDEDRNSSTKYAPLPNMLSAVQLITSLLNADPVASLHTNSRGVANESETATKPATRHYGILGGFSIQLRGGRRSTRDIDLVTDRTMKGVWDAVGGVERVVIPDSRLIEGVIKVFIKTGPPWDACSECWRIEVDVKQAGFYGSPRKVHENTEIIGPFSFFGDDVSFSVVRIPAMARIKVDCCLSRAEPRDFADVKFMIVSYTEEVRGALEAGMVEEEDLLEVLEDGEVGDEEVRADLRRRLQLGKDA